MLFMHRMQPAELLRASSENVTLPESEFSSATPQTSIDSYFCLGLLLTCKLPWESHPQGLYRRTLK